MHRPAGSIVSGCCSACQSCGPLGGSGLGQVGKANFSRVICGRPLGSKRVSERWARSRVLTSVRPLLRPWMPRARMGVRGPAPYQDRVLEGTLTLSGFADPVSSTVAPYRPLPLLPPQQPPTDKPLMQPRQEFDRPRLSPVAPKLCAPSCWPMPRSPACAACARACPPAKN